MRRNKILNVKILPIAFMVFFSINVNSQNLKIHYGLSGDTVGNYIVIDESGNGYNGELLNGAVISTFDSVPVIDLGTSNGYVDLGNLFGNVVASLTDFTIVIKLYIPGTSNITHNGNFVWSFANSNDILNDANGCLFFSAKNTRYAITPKHYSSESGIDNGEAVIKGEWLTIIYVQNNGIGMIYINGLLIVTGEISMTPSELGVTPHNYLGRSSYISDDYLNNAKIADFSIYDAPIDKDMIDSLSGITTSFSETKVLVKFNFTSNNDSSLKYTGTLNNGAVLDNYNNLSILKLGENNGYFDFGSDFGNIVSQLDSFSISTNLMIPSNIDIDNTGNFVWTFANSTNMASDANGNMFFGARNTCYAIAKTNYTDEKNIKTNNELPKGKWINITYTQYNNIGTLFIDGNLIAQGNMDIIPMELGITPYNFLGRSCYSGDAYLNSAMFDNFIIYQGALNKTGILKLCERLDLLNNVLDSMTLMQAVDDLDINDIDTTRSSIFLPVETGDGVQISWSSSHPDIISVQGLINPPPVGSDPVNVTITALFQYNNVSNTKLYEITVLPYFSDSVSIHKDLEELTLIGNLNNLRSSVHLPEMADEGSVITWKSDSPEYLNCIGNVIKLSPLGNGKKKVVLTAMLKKGEEQASKTFEVWIAEEEDRSGYLFVYFTGNDTNGEQIRFAVSNDGINYTPLNNGNRVIYSDTISLKKGVRDPHILRSEDGGTFYMVVTDMKSAEGWNSNRGIVLLKSNDLINWTHSTVNFPAKWPASWGNVQRVWAPQCIFDPVSEKYMVYFSLYTGETNCPYDRIYYSYANDDFTDLEGEPILLFDRETATIDGDIVFNETDSLYYMFFKNESLGGISQVTSKNLCPTNGADPGSQWSEPSPPVQQTYQAVEGSGVFRIINTDKWVLMYDCYTSGHYQYCTSSDLKNFSYVKDNYEISARHGTTISVSNEEMERLIAKWPSTALSNVPQGAHNIKIKKDGCSINTLTRKIDIAVNYGTDLMNFDPLLYASPGTLILPTGNQDFSSGDINYSFTQNGTTANYDVSVKIEVNPVIPDFHADPEILYSQKMNRFYLYPTTDGYPGWGGFSFDVFSSPDLVNWTNAGTILDLSSNQVFWANGNAWAPCIEEKKMNDGTYKYFFFFSGNDGIKKIGVAIANNPTGPFFDLGAPMISQLPDGVSGQLIDGDVFTDPVSGKSYFYWGNGYMAVAEFNDDMVSFKDNSVKVITPSGGSLNDYAYREGPYVFYRNSLYYFLWSVDDTGSDNYHVAYGTSTSPTGPITVASSPIVIIQDPANYIYGTGHNSILKLPEKDQWYIVYHRINASFLNNGPGYHREVCIDKLEFNPDGTIKQTIPTRRGIDPVIINDSSTNIEKDIFNTGQLPNGKVIKREIFDLSGRLINNNINSLKDGIYIVREIYENGAVKTYKFLITI